MSNAFYAPVRQHQRAAQALAHICELNNLGNLLAQVRERYPNFGRGKSPHGENDFWGIEMLIGLLPQDILHKPLITLLGVTGLAPTDPPPPPPPKAAPFMPELPLADAVHPSIQVVDIAPLALPAPQIAALLPAWTPSTVQARQASGAEAFGITEPGENVPSPSVRRYKANRGEPVLFGHKPAFGNTPYRKVG